MTDAGARDTLVLQSFRPTGAPDWIDRCLRSVRSWAAAHGHSYLQMDDALFDIVPPWFAERCGGARLPITDLARLLWIRRFLREGWRRIIWLDADVLVTRPAAFAPDPVHRHAVGREYWLRRGEDGALIGEWAVTNCGLAFTAESALLDFYIETAEAIVRGSGSVHPLTLGPRLLTPLGLIAPLPLIPDLATSSPLLTAEIAGGVASEVTAAHRAAWRAPVNAVHFCGSTAGASDGPAQIAEAIVARAIDRLAADPGLIG